MDVSLLLRALGLIFVFYILAKALAPFLSDFFSNKSKDKDHDLDAMIKRKMELFKVTGQGTDLTSSGAQVNKSTTEHKSENRKNYAEEVKLLFRKLSLESTKTDQQRAQMSDLKRTMEILDAIQWGSSSEMSSIRKRFEKSFDLAPEEAAILFALRMTLGHAALFNQRSEPISSDELIDLCCCATFHHLLSQSFIEGSSQFVNLLARRWHVQAVMIQQAWLTWLAKKNKLPMPTFTAELLKFKQLNAQSMLVLLGHGIDGLAWTKILNVQGQGYKPSLLFDEIREELTIMKAINPLEINGALNEAQALHVLGFQSLPAPGILSRRYKKFARLMHPDKLVSYGFSNEVLELAANNFRTIKEAYDLLKSKME